MASNGDLDGRVHVRVAGVEAEAQVVQVRVDDEMLERGGRADLVRGIFEGDRDAAGLREYGENFERCEGRIELALVGGITAMSNMLDKIAEGDAFSHIEGALHFVDRIEAPDALGIGNRDGDAAFAAGRKVALRRRMQGVELEMIFAKRVS